MEKDMKKYLRKVALRTFSLLLSVLVLLFCIFLLALPKVASNMFGKLGMDKASADFSKVTYDRSGDFNDLALLFDRSVSGNNYAYLYKYGEILIEDKNFSDYAEFRLVNYSETHYTDYVYGNLAVGMFEQGDSQRSVAFIDSKTIDDYFVGCSLSIFATHLSDKAKVKEVVAIYPKIEGLFEKVYQKMSDGGKDTKTLCADAYSLAVKCGDTDLQTLWQTRYN